MKLKTLVLASALFATTVAWANVELSPLFVQLSDAMAESKKGEFAKSSQILTALQQDFAKITEQHSLKLPVNEAIQHAISTPDAAHLETLAKALYAFEKAQNPVDHRAKQHDFLAKMNPLYAQLQQATQTNHLAEIKKAARHFGKNWAKHEKSLREISLHHYGQFERSLGLMRIAITSENPDLDKIKESVAELGRVMADFNQFQIPP